MKFTIKYLGQDGGAPTEYGLSMGQTLSFGSTKMADIHMHLSAFEPCICAEVSYFRTGLHLHCAPSNPLSVSLNSRSITGTKRLEPGDLFSVGPYRFQIDRANSQFPAPSSEPMESQPVPALDRQTKSTMVNSIVTQHTPHSEQWTTAELMEELFDKTNIILFANFKFASLDVPSDLDVGDDWYENAPDEVRCVHSLRAITDGSPEQRLALAQTLIGKDAGFLGLPESSIEDCLSGLKLFSAWFARPSVLELFLENSSPELSQKLLAPFRGLILPSRSSADSWVAYSQNKYLVEQIIPGSLSLNN